MNRNLKYLTVALIGGAVSLAVGFAIGRFMPKAAVFIASGAAASLVSYIAVSRITAPEVNRMSKPSKPSGAFQNEGRRAVVERWEQSGLIGKMSSKLEAARKAAKGKTKPKRKNPPKGKKPNPTTDPVNDASDLNTD